MVTKQTAVSWGLLVHGYMFKWFERFWNLKIIGLLGTKLLESILVLETGTLRILLPSIGRSLQFINTDLLKRALVTAFLFLTGAYIYKWKCHFDASQPVKISKNQMDSMIQWI